MKRCLPALASAALLAACLAASAQESKKAIPAKVAPAVGGELLAVAVQQVKLAELKCETGVFFIAPDKWRDDLTAGAVHLQAPRAKALVLPADAVALWTFQKAAADQKIVDVPDLTGLTAADAAKKLAEVGLEPTKSTDPDEPVPAGKVADQYPKAKQSVYTRTSVFLRYR